MFYPSDLNWWQLALLLTAWVALTTFLEKRFGVKLRAKSKYARMAGIALTAIYLILSFSYVLFPMLWKNF